MLEVWACKEDAEVRRVTARGGTLPVELGSRDWTRLGDYAATADIEEAVARRRCHDLRTDQPVPDPDALKNSNAAGARMPSGQTEAAVNPGARP